MGGRGTGPGGVSCCSLIWPPDVGRAAEAQSRLGAGGDLGRASRGYNECSLLWILPVAHSIG